MPKAPVARAARSSKPYAKPTSSRPTKVSKSDKDPKQSHLYTDDNPSTTLHGTGFKDAATARRTIDLVTNRSLTYQWQVINTMFCRARGHPAMRKARSAKANEDTAEEVTDDTKPEKKSQSGTKGMEEAMEIFRNWLDVTYPEAKEERKQNGHEFKPLLKKEVVGRYLDRIRNLDKPGHADNQTQRFAELYSDLPKGKRLANVLVEEEHPEKEDWDIAREKSLIELLREKERNGWEKEDGLWNEKGGLSDWHLRCIAWAWSPVGERRLPP